jgi:hypothetical protein
MKLIMLSAMYENGGNTTHRMLDGHPNLLVYPFESQVGTGAISDYLASFVPVRYRWPEFAAETRPEDAYEMFWDEELKTFLRAPSRSKFSGCGIVMDEADRKARFCEYASSRPLTRATFVAAYFYSTFASWQNCNRTAQESHFVGYNPVLVLDTDKIFTDFPDAHVVHVVRNPWSGYSDTCKRPFPISLKRYAWTWNYCQHFALTYRRKYSGNFHIVRFEDLVADRAATTASLLNKIGLPMSEKCLEPSFNGSKLEEVYPWGTIRIPTPDMNIQTAHELSQEQRAQIKCETGVMCAALEYQDPF